MEEKHHGSEIVIRITPRNLERLIYILVIIGLIVVSIIGFSRDASNCPEIVCDDEEVVEGIIIEEVVEEIVEEENTSVANSDVLEGLSGEIEFLFTDVQLCIVNETDDNGRFDSVSVYIKNGLDRMLNAKIQLYLWNDDDSFDEINHRGPYIDNIKVMSGAPYTHQFKIDDNDFSSKGYFKDIDVDKKIKASLIDDDLNQEIDETTLINIEASFECD